MASWLYQGFLVANFERWCDMACWALVILGYVVVGVVTAFSLGISDENEIRDRGLALIAGVIWPISILCFLENLRGD